MPYEEFIAIKEELENYEDVKGLRKTKEFSKNEKMSYFIIYKMYVKTLNCVNNTVYCLPL